MLAAHREGSYAPALVTVPMPSTCWCPPARASGLRSPGGKILQRATPGGGGLTPEHSGEHVQESSVSDWPPFPAPSQMGAAAPGGVCVARPWGWGSGEGLAHGP